MYEFTSVFLKPYNYAKRAYEYFLGLSSDNQLTVTPGQLVSQVQTSIPTNRIDIQTPEDYNENTLSTMSSLAGMFKSIDQAHDYIGSLYSSLNGRILESEKRLQDLTGTLNTLATSKLFATTSVQVRGGDVTPIETDSKYYRLFQPLVANPEEGTFVLKDSGFFSSIRSLGGFAGQIAIEHTLGDIVNSGSIQNIVDGSRNSFWMGTFYAPAPVRADQNDIIWLPLEYKHGFAFQLTYFLDRKTLATEIFLDPVSTEAFDLVSVSWTPDYITNTLNETNFPASGWTRYGTATTLSSGGVNNDYALLVTASSGYIAKTFAIPSSALTSSGSAVNTGSRAELSYYLKGLGDCFAGARLVWLNSSGSAISYKLNESYPTGFYKQVRMVDVIPSNAASGRVEFGIFTNCTGPASAYIDEPVLYLGEEMKDYGVVLDKPTTLSLPKTVKSSRFSFVFSQRNPRRELFVKEAGPEVPNILLNNKNISLTLTNNLQKQIDSIQSQGPGTSTFAYRIGFKELDLRYREHAPRGGLVTKPLNTNKEVRELWITTELGKDYDDGVQFKLYPFKDDITQIIYLNPFKIGLSDTYNPTTLSDGDVVKIYTNEEYVNNWVNLKDKFFIVNPKAVTATYDGTDRNGKLRLEKPLHLRRPTLRSILDWLQTYGIWNRSYDPNSSILYGLDTTTAAGSSLLSQLVSNTLTSSGVALSTFKSKAGYQPIKITVITDKWVARPDTFGRPDLTRVRTVDSEILGTANLSEYSSSAESSVITLDAWLSQTTGTQLVTLDDSLRYLGEQIGWSGIDRDTRSLKTIQLTNPGWYGPYFASYYDMLKQKGKLAPSSGFSTVVSTTLNIGDGFATRFAPIITGNNGAFLRLYWLDPIANLFIPVPTRDYSVLSTEKGVIRMMATPPATSYTNVVASYKYISDTESEDHFSTVLSFVNNTASSLDLASSEIPLQSKAFPLTRNMTDYLEGKVSKLKPPNFNKLSKDYYPIIEYYVTPEGEVVFSREFFKYGEYGGTTIVVESETLDIEPRAGIEVRREGSSATTPRIFNFSLRVREGAASLIKEVK